MTKAQATAEAGKASKTVPPRTAQVPSVAETPSAPAVPTGKEAKTKRPSSKARRGRPALRGFAARFFAFVLLPTLLAGVYFGFFASDVFVSETRFAIRSSGQSQPEGFLAALFSSGAGAASEDTIVVRDYVHSREMLDKLDAELGLREHYSSHAADWLSRLPADASYERFLDYYRDKVQVVLETGTGIITLTARAFSPEASLAISKRLVVDSELLVNQMSDRIRDDTLSLVREELDLAEQRVRAASATITEYRNRTKLVDPTQETGAVLGIISELESQLATARAELSTARSFMQPDSARVRTLNANVAALEAQVKLERDRLVSGDSADLTGRIDGYLPLALDQEFAQQQYASALASFELARAEVQRKQQYLVPFVQPDLPREAREPERVKGVLTVFVAALLIYAFTSLIVAGFRDHAGL